MLNYLGPSDGEGIYVYQDGVQTGNNITPYFNGPFPLGDGRVVLGRAYIDSDENYGSVSLDELLFFNVSLSIGQIVQLKNMVSK